MSRDHFKVNPKAKAQEVVDALASHGITVSVGLVRIVKSKHNKAHAAKKAAKAKQAKTNGVNKSQAIRDFFKANKKAKTSELVEALAKKGITVTAKLVTTVKSKHNTRREAVRKVVAKGGVGIPEVKAALAFIKAMGGVAAAKKALEVAQEIKAIV
jgi:hypothetical protein